MTWIQVQLATCYIHESGLQSQVPLVQTTQIIIECDSTVIYRGNAKTWRAYITPTLLIYKNITSGQVLSPSQHLEVLLSWLLTSGENLVEVVNWQKVKK